MYFGEKLSTVVEGLCGVMKQACEKAGLQTDPDHFIRAEICFFALYLMSENGSFDWDELEDVENTIKYRTDRSRWGDAVKLFRVDSEENYLSKPPETIDFMLQADNALYEMGLDLGCVSATMDVYKVTGEIIVNNKGFFDENRDRRLIKFTDMIDRYQYENAKNPAHRVKSMSEEQDIVIPSKKGVSAPKKS